MLICAFLFYCYWVELVLSVVSDSDAAEKSSVASDSDAAEETSTLLASDCGGGVSSTLVASDSEVLSVASAAAEVS